MVLSSSAKEKKAILILPARRQQIIVEDKPITEVMINDELLNQQAYFASRIEDKLMFNIFDRLRWGFLGK